MGKRNNFLSLSLTLCYMLRCLCLYFNEMCCQTKVDFLLQFMLYVAYSCCDNIKHSIGTCTEFFFFLCCMHYSKYHKIFATWPAALFNNIPRFYSLLWGVHVLLLFLLFTCKIFYTLCTSYVLYTFSCKSSQMIFPLIQERNCGKTVF